MVMVIWQKEKKKERAVLEKKEVYAFGLTNVTAERKTLMTMLNC